MVRMPACRSRSLSAVIAARPSGANAPVSERLIEQLDHAHQAVEGPVLEVVRDGQDFAQARGGITARQARGQHGHDRRQRIAVERGAAAIEARDVEVRRQAPERGREIPVRLRRVGRQRVVVRPHRLEDGADILGAPGGNQRPRPPDPRLGLRSAAGDQETHRLTTALALTLPFAGLL